MGVQCSACGGHGSTTESCEIEVQDKNGNWTTKQGTKTTSCKTCGGKGYVG